VLGLLIGRASAERQVVPEACRSGRVDVDAIRGIQRAVSFTRHRDRALAERVGPLVHAHVLGDVPRGGAKDPDRRGIDRSHGDAGPCEVGGADAVESRAKHVEAHPRARRIDPQRTDGDRPPHQGSSAARGAAWGGCAARPTRRRVARTDGVGRRHRTTRRDRGRERLRSHIPRDLDRDLVHEARASGRRVPRHGADGDREKPLTPRRHDMRCRDPIGLAALGRARRLAPRAPTGSRPPLTRARIDASVRRYGTGTGRMVPSDREGVGITDARTRAPHGTRRKTVRTGKRWSAWSDSFRNGVQQVDLGERRSEETRRARPWALRGEREPCSRSAGRTRRSVREPRPPVNLEGSTRSESAVPSVRTAAVACVRRINATRSARLPRSGSWDAVDDREPEAAVVARERPPGTVVLQILPALRTHENREELIADGRAAPWAGPARLLILLGHGFGSSSAFLGGSDRGGFLQVHPHLQILLQPSIQELLLREGR
jgi:hypothetical protein